MVQSVASNTILLAALAAYHGLRLLFKGIYATGIMDYFDGLATVLALTYVFGGIFLIDAFMWTYAPLIVPIALLFDTIVFSKPKRPMN